MPVSQRISCVCSAHILRILCARERLGDDLSWRRPPAVTANPYWAFGYVTSSDGVTWKKSTASPLLSLASVSGWLGFYLSTLLYSGRHEFHQRLGGQPSGPTDNVKRLAWVGVGRAVSARATCESVRPARDIRLQDAHTMLKFVGQRLYEWQIARLVGGESVAAQTLLR